MRKEQNKLGFIRKFTQEYLFAAVPVLYLGLGAIVTNVGVERVGEYSVRRTDEFTSIQQRISGVCSMTWTDQDSDGIVDVKYTVCLPGRFMPSHPLQSGATSPWHLIFF